MASYDFRILVETVKGKQFSYLSSSFFNSEVNANYAVSASEVISRIKSSTSCSYINQYSYSGDFHDKEFRHNIFLSSSLDGNGETGSIKFVYTGLTGSSTNQDRLSRFKFFGTKVCDVLNLTENFWYRPSKFLLSSGSTDNFFKGNIDAVDLNVANSFKIASAGAVSSDLPFIVTKDNSRFIQFLNISGSNEVPNMDLKIGYDDTTNTYMISASARANDTTKFVIDGVTELNTITMSSTYVTSSVRQIFSEITSSGNSMFGDAITDTHTFNGAITASADISSSGIIYGKQMYFTHHNFDEPTNNDANYVPINNHLEAPTLQFHHKWVAPYDGELIKVIARAENDCGETLISFQKNASITATEAQDLDADTSLTYSTLNTRLGAAAVRTFDAGDVLSLKFKPTNTPGEVQITAAWLYTIGP